jgi:TPR repeat protein
LRTATIIKNYFAVASLFRVALGLSFATFSFLAQSEELVSFNNVSASVPREHQCQAEVNVRLDAPEEESYRKSRVDMQKLAQIVKTYLWLDCKEIESIDFEGYTEGDNEALYRATIEKKNDWFLQERPVGESDEGKQKEAEKNQDEQSSSLTDATKDTEPANEESVKFQAELAQQNNSSSSAKEGNQFSSLDSLEAAAVTSSDAQLELAKGLLDLPDKIEGIEFPDDAARGIEILEKLAAEGNPDATQLLSQSYSSDNNIDLNIPLIEALTGRPMIDGEEQRGTASAMMTLDAAAKGSELAVDALQDAGQAGSNMSYYALGMMYLLDQAMNMPYDQTFLEQELEIESDVAGSGGSGNVDVGLYFLTLAAENGNSEAQELLTDMEVEFEMPGSSPEPAPAPAPAPEPSSGSSGEVITSLLSRSSATASADNPSESESQSSVQTGESEETESNQSVNPSEESAQAGAVAATTSVSNTAAKNENYTESLMAEGALHDVLDRRNQAGSSEPDTTTRNSIASPQRRPSSKPELGPESKHNIGSGVGMRSSRQTVQEAAQRRQSSMQRRGHTEYGNMNTEQNEAEIID